MVDFLSGFPASFDCFWFTLRNGVLVVAFDCMLLFPAVARVGGSVMASIYAKPFSLMFLIVSIVEA